MTLWWCPLGREWNVSFLTLQARSPNTRSQSWCKLLSDDCLSIVLHIPLSAGCPFTIQVTSGNSFTTQVSCFHRTGSALCRPMFVCLWQNSNLRPALPDRLSFPSHQAIHLPTTTSLTIPLEILNRNLDNPSRCQQHCLAFCFVFIFVFSAPNHPSQHNLTPHHLDSAFSWTLLVV